MHNYLNAYSLLTNQIDCEKLFVLYFTLQQYVEVFEFEWMLCASVQKKKQNETK